MNINLQAKQRLTAHTKIEADLMAGELKHLAQKLGEKLGIKVKECTRLDVEEGKIVFESKIDKRRLASIPHKGNKYFPDGEGPDSGWLEIEHLLEDEATVLVVVG